MAIMEFQQAFSMCTAGFFLMLVFMIDPTFQLPTKIAATTDADFTTDLLIINDTTTISAPTTEIITKNDKTTQTVFNSTTPGASTTVFESTTPGPSTTPTPGPSTTPKPTHPPALSQISMSTSKSGEKSGCESIVLCVVLGVSLVFNVVLIALCIWLKWRQRSNRMGGQSKTQNEEHKMEIVASSSNKDESESAVDSDPDPLDSQSLQSDSSQDPSDTAARVIEGTSESYKPLISEEKETGKKESEGRISRVELWKLREYARKFDEIDKLDELLSALDAPKTYDRYQAGESDIFQSLCEWKRDCDGETQVDKLEEACLQADMQDTWRKMKDFRESIKQQIPEYDLEHILWQIWKKSSENMRVLINDRLPTPRFPKIDVQIALSEVLTWQHRELTINPLVILDLETEDLYDEASYFFEVPDDKKSPLDKSEVEQHVLNVSFAHCDTLMKIVTATKSHRKKNKVLKNANTILRENDKYIFGTTQMIQDWLKDQECSNYEKRDKLERAIERAKNASKSSEITSDMSEYIEELSASKSVAEIAYELIMSDIRPFAKELGVQERLTHYNRSSVSDEHRGTAELVAEVYATKKHTK